MSLIKDSIGILITVCSRNQAYTSFEEIPLMKTFMPGFNETKENKFEYVFFIGFDDTDEFYMENEHLLQRQGLKTVILKGCEHKPAKAWNILLEKAYEFGCEYFFQVGDDVRMITSGWTSTFINTLKSRKNIGVTGPLDSDTKDVDRINTPDGIKFIIENAFFHRTHYQIFGYLFHREIDNHFCDKWLTEIYSIHKAAILIENVKCSNSIRNVRYNSKPVPLLNTYIVEGVLKISSYLCNTKIGDDVFKTLKPTNSKQFSIFLDTTIIHRIDENRYSGVQRVVKNIAKSLCTLLPIIEPINFCKNTPPIANGKFKSQLCGYNSEDKEVIIAPGDILFLLDDSIYYIHNMHEVLMGLRSQGVTIVTLIHDVIPITHHKYVTQDHMQMFIRWFQIISDVSSGILCVSETTKTEILKIKPLLDVKSFHLGNDITPSGQYHLLGLPTGKNVLMTGTIEPRKCYEETLDVFDKIWETRDDINLIIVGRVGWLTEKLVKRITTHPLLLKRLFWLADASDSDLVYLYKNSDLFLFSSEIEGFGIPLIEAAKFNLPLLLRDTPVFREIATDNALYFTSFEQLIEPIPKILDKIIVLPESIKIKMNTWEDAALDCLNHILKFRLDHLRKLKIIQ